MDKRPEKLGSVSLGEHLASLPEFWEHWGFVPWREGVFCGVARKQRFVKKGLLGPVAEYAAWEAILWEGGSEAERAALWKARGPLPEVMTQRFLFLLNPAWPERKIRSFAWGFRGYLEFYAYWPKYGADTGGLNSAECVGFTGNPKVRDLTGLVDLAVQLKQ